MNSCIPKQPISTLENTCLLEQHCVQLGEKMEQIQMSTKHRMEK